MDNVFHFRVRKSNVWRVILDVNPGNHYQSHEFDNIYQIIMGIVDKNYLNRVGQKVKNDLSKQPCGCDCNCRPKFEDESGSGPTPGCNCSLRTNYFVGDWSNGNGPLNTGQIFLIVANGWNCPFEMSFRWMNVNFSIIGAVNVVLTTPTSTVFMSPSVWYNVTLQPGDFIQFDFGGINETFDQTLYVESRNATCAQNYGVVGSYTLTAI